MAPSIREPLAPQYRLVAEVIKGRRQAHVDVCCSQPPRRLPDRGSGWVPDPRETELGRVPVRSRWSLNSCHKNRLPRTWRTGRQKTKGDCLMHHHARSLQVAAMLTLLTLVPEQVRREAIAAAQLKRFRGGRDRNRSSKTRRRGPLARSGRSHAWGIAGFCRRHSASAVGDYQ